MAHGHDWRALVYRTGRILAVVILLAAALHLSMPRSSGGSSAGVRWNEGTTTAAQPSVIRVAWDGSDPGGKRWSAHG